MRSIRLLSCRFNAAPTPRGCHHRDPAERRDDRHWFLVLASNHGAALISRPDAARAAMLNVLDLGVSGQRDVSESNRPGASVS